jgi:hypothetical protein
MRRIVQKQACRAFSSIVRTNEHHSLSPCKSKIVEAILGGKIKLPDGECRGSSALPRRGASSTNTTADLKDIRCYVASLEYLDINALKGELLVTDSYFGESNLQRLLMYCRRLNVNTETRLLIWNHTVSSLLEVWRDAIIVFISLLGFQPTQLFSTYPYCCIFAARFAVIVGYEGSRVHVWEDDCGFRQQAICRRTTQTGRGAESGRSCPSYRLASIGSPIREFVRVWRR